MRTLILISVFGLSACGQFTGDDAPRAIDSGDCLRLSLTEAQAAISDLETIGEVGAWKVFGDDRLACSEVYSGDKAECELQEDGVIVLENGQTLIGLKNNAGALVSTKIEPSGATCSVLQGD